MGCCTSRSPAQASPPAYPEGAQPADLAEVTHFNTNEVEALFHCFNPVAHSVKADGQIHKEEFLGVMGGQHGLFMDRIFDVLDTERNGVISFAEFVKGLSVFHPRASQNEKEAMAFKIYDLRGTGAIEKEEVRDMLMALMRDNPHLLLSEEHMTTIIERTFDDVDLARDGKIHPSEWAALVERNPQVLNNMTLHALRDLTTKFPSFIFSSDANTSHKSIGDVIKQTLHLDE
mmetsp:Transcript_19309/g.62814  ORF Transcript_19309/g.62814 Transcript_19309/m.62814 type:complete len:231 (-) Transcript_19309:291-983(-)